MGVKLRTSGEHIIDCWPAYINFQQASSGEQWRWIIVAMGLPSPPKLNYSILLFIAVFAVTASHADAL